MECILGSFGGSGLAWTELLLSQGLCVCVCVCEKVHSEVKCIKDGFVLVSLKYGLDFGYLDLRVTWVYAKHL